ncbi:hypothetical protein HanLR1_Chr09g0297691 [Helianthus annuus]|nr:hypothetical protein HanLR1_Chr09g0297691 [Helianthus annuus]
MEDFRSKSYNANSMQIQPYNNNNPPNLQDFRCYSTSHASSSSSQTHMDQNEPKFKKHNSKSTNGSMSKNWSFSDPEMQRKKRLLAIKHIQLKEKSKGQLRRALDGLKISIHKWYMG